MRGATPRSRSGCRRRHFNPRSSCEERHLDGPCAVLGAAISIHAPHARSDSTRIVGRCRPCDFNPRSSCEERRRTRLLAQKSQIFQSTLLMRGATGSGRRTSRSSSRFQSTLLMRGATKDENGNPLLTEFQSTLLMRGATHQSAIILYEACKISIHAPHARSDLPPMTAARHNQ